MVRIIVLEYKSRSSRARSKRNKKGKRSISLIHVFLLFSTNVNEPHFCNDQPNRGLKLSFVNFYMLRSPIVEHANLYSTLKFPIKEKSSVRKPLFFSFRFILFISNLYACLGMRGIILTFLFKF